MKSKQLVAVPVVVLGLGVTLSARPQDASTTQTTQQSTATEKKHGRSPGGDVASGTGDIGKGAAGAAGHAAAGAGKGAVDLVTLHPINAAGDVGKGAAYAGKDAGVGAVKGTGKIVKGIGRGIRHIF
jgi:hypothetical protein